jgi:hypothetical protein
MVTLSTVVLAGLAGVLLAACGGSSNTASTSSTQTPSGSNGSSGGGSSATAQIRSLSSALQGAQHATFKAVYQSTNPGGTNETITIEQKPPSRCSARRAAR